MIHSRVLCLLFSWSLLTKTHTIHILLSEAALKLQKSFQTSHSGDMIALLFKRTKVSSLSVLIFPCPPQTTIHTKFIFLH